MVGKTTAEQFMDKWLKQKNYPQVEVLLDRNATKTNVKFMQSRFLITEFEEEITPIFVSPYG